MTPLIAIIVGTICATAIIVVILLRRSRTFAAGEICIAAGIYQCTFCGQIKPFCEDDHFPICDIECQRHGGRWNAIGFCDHEFVIRRAGGDPTTPGAEETISVCKHCGCEDPEPL